MSNAIFFQTTTVQSRIGAVHGAPVVSSYFFSVLYFYVIFVLPFIVK